MYNIIPSEMICVYSWGIAEFIQWKIKHFISIRWLQKHMWRPRQGQLSVCGDCVVILQSSVIREPIPCNLVWYPAMRLNKYLLVRPWRQYDSNPIWVHGTCTWKEPWKPQDLWPVNVLILASVVTYTSVPISHPWSQQCCRYVILNWRQYLPAYKPRVSHLLSGCSRWSYAHHSPIKADKIYI